jgi:hypothetical protein
VAEPDEPVAEPDEPVAEPPGEPLAEPQISIVYDAMTGHLALDVPEGVELTSINIESAAGVFTGESVAIFEGPFDIDSDTTIFKATFGSSFGSVRFGNVAQPLLEQSFLENDLTVTGSLWGRNGDLGGVDLVYRSSGSTPT